MAVSDDIGTTDDGTQLSRQEYEEQLSEQIKEHVTYILGSFGMFETEFGISGGITLGPGITGKRNILLNDREVGQRLFALLKGMAKQGTGEIAITKRDIKNNDAKYYSLMVSIESTGLQNSVAGVYEAIAQFTGDVVTAIKKPQWRARRNAPRRK